MEKIINYIKKHWILIVLGGSIFGFYCYLTYTGNQFCDCEKTETFKDGTTRSHSSGHSFYRYYHK
ncbi:MAG TPA: hypothetical protein PK067_11145 [Kaistella chaponensis]|uniref:hypothetical protein n=1 Tax=Kaistella chaponensis TaxID=713588 RepID=UPI002C5903BF|nr:hypothetical protein [Kaistella chaponensis]HPW89384.1 hypothetical protein [Kaistella chaponensis]HQC07566.1 hypothetical protein [Kaistella chaponensis]